MKKSFIRTWLPLVILSSAAIATVVFQQYSLSAAADLAAERDARCAKQAASVYVPFKDHLDCVTWSQK